VNFYATEEKVARVEFGRCLPTFRRNLQPSCSSGDGGVSQKTVILKKKTVREVWRP
jgi:hypothetical protein